MLIPFACIVNIQFVCLLNSSRYSNPRILSIRECCFIIFFHAIKGAVMQIRNTTAIPHTSGKTGTANGAPR